MNQEQQKILEVTKTVITQIFMHIEIKDLIKENLALKKIANLENISINDYIRLANTLDFKWLDIAAIVEDTEDILADLKQQSLATIIKSFYCERLCDIFNVYFDSCYSKKYSDNGEYDDNCIPKKYPQTIKDFIQAAYRTFENIRHTAESFDLIDLIESESDNTAYKNLIKIFALIFLGKIRRGRNITPILFDKIGKNSIIPESFKRLCRIKKGQYIIFNTDWDTVDFQIAVFDLIQFVDNDNKKLFNNKVNQYFKVAKTND